jgi:hypothetical protein
MRRSAGDKRNKVFLTALDNDGRIIEEMALSSEDYYQGLSDLIDSAAYRERKGIVKVTGRIYDPHGDVDQEFANEYDERGRYLRGKTIHRDGTVIES